MVCRKCTFVGRGVMKTGQAKVSGSADVRGLHWDDLRFFLAVVEQGSFRKAAGKLETTVTTVSRHIESLEERLGGPVVTRWRDGVRLTPLGRDLVADAREVGSVMERISYKARSTLEAFTGKVRLAVTEGLATYWVMPKLIGLQRTYPNLTIETVSPMNTVDVGTREADIAIQLAGPKDLDLTMQKIGRLHISFFVSQHYRNLYGEPKSIEELKQHKLIIQSSDQLDNAMLMSVLGITDPTGIVAFQVDASSVNYMLVAKGAGVGILPTYTNALGADLIPLDLGKRHAYDIYLTYRPDAMKLDSNRVVIEWIRKSFDARKFPWFGDEFISPLELAKLNRNDWEDCVLPPVLPYRAPPV